ncbi:MAG: hypothetical protein IK151_04110 [Erysipelotrichaceae bacterium]|nr:hypothetical protein [Erysipelotrichaceae bacterium]
MNKYSKDDLTSYSLGMSLTIEALKHQPKSVKEVVLSEKAIRNEQLSYLLSLCKENDIKIVYDDKTIDKLSLKENCYCIGVFNKFYSELSSNRHIVLYGFNDFGDLGTVLRSAVSFDFKDIVLINSDIDYFDPRCIRASMGSIFHCNIVTYSDLNEYLSKYRKYNIYPFVSQSEKNLSDVSFKDPYAIIISQDYQGLDGLFTEAYMIEHSTLEEISLSLRSSIILAEAFAQKRSL